MSEAIETLQKYLSDKTNIIHYYGNDALVKKLFDALYNGTIHDYKAPDMYVKYEKEIWLIEHFEIDCYKHNRKGSAYRIEQNRVDQKFEHVTPSNNGTVFHETIEGTSSYEDYVSNVKNSFLMHYCKIDNYKQSLIDKNIAVENTKFVVMFLIDDVSPLGTSYIDKKGKWRPIFLSNCKEFLDILNNSPNVDCVLSTSCSSREKYIWFIDRNNLDEHYKNAEDYKNGEFVAFKPHVIGGKIIIPNDK